MENEITISEDERERLETGEEFEFPKYASTILNAAMNTAGANKAHTVGQTSEIRKEFRQEYPDGTYEDWVDFYNREYNGEERIDEAIEKTHQMLQNFKEVIDEIDKEMVRDYIHEFIYYKTPQGFDDEQVIFEKLAEVYDKEYQNSTAEEEPEGIDGYLDDQPVSIKPESFKRKGDPDEIDAPVVYYEDFSTTNKLVLDVSELNEVFGSDMGNDATLDDF